jgi:hypothetical protein
MPKPDSKDSQKKIATVDESSGEMMYWKDMATVAERDVAALQRLGYSDDEVVDLIVNEVLDRFSDVFDEVAQTTLETPRGKDES